MFLETWAVRARQNPQLIPQEGPRSSKAAETTKEPCISWSCSNRYGQRCNQQWTTNPTLASNRGGVFNKTLRGFDRRLPQASPCRILLRGSCVWPSLLNHHLPTTAKNPARFATCPSVLRVSAGMALPVERNPSLQKMGSQSQRKWHSPAALANLCPPAARDSFCPQLPPGISRLGMSAVRSL